MPLDREKWINIIPDMPSHEKYDSLSWTHCMHSSRKEGRKGVQVHQQKCRRVNGKFTLLVQWGYICTEVNHTIYIRIGTTSVVYFTHKSKAFKVEPVNKLENPGSEKPISTSITIKR